MSKPTDTVDIDSLNDQFESFVTPYSTFPIVRWESDNFPDDVADAIIYMNDIIDLAEILLNIGETKGVKHIPKSIYNDFIMFIKGFNYVYESAESKSEFYIN
jgi:hypothetical protein